MSPRPDRVSDWNVVACAGEGESRAREVLRRYPFLEVD